MLQPEDAAHRTAGGRLCLVEEFREMLAIVGVNEIRNPFAQQCIRRTSQDVTAGRAQVQQPTVAAEEGDAVGAVLDERTKPLFVFTDTARSARAFGDPDPEPLCAAGGPHEAGEAHAVEPDRLIEMRVRQVKRPSS